LSPKTLPTILVLLLVVSVGCGPLPQRAGPDPALIVGQTAYTVCSELCRERGMCRQLPDIQGRYQSIIHTRAQPGGHGVALKYLEVGAQVTLHEVQVNLTRDAADPLYGDALYQVSSPAWDPTDRYWVPVYCLAPEPPESGD
jgi:hypothetical protein